MGIIVIEIEKLNFDSVVNIFVYKEIPKDYFHQLVFLFTFREYRVYGGDWCYDLIKNNFEKVQKYIIEYIENGKNNDPNLF